MGSVECGVCVVCVNICTTMHWVGCAGLATKSVFILKASHGRVSTQRASAQTCLLHHTSFVKHRGAHGHRLCTGHGSMDVVRGWDLLTGPQIEATPVSRWRPPPAGTH
jgi:hypothetical protein